MYIWGMESDTGALHMKIAILGDAEAPNYGETWNNFLSIN